MMKLKYKLLISFCCVLIAGFSHAAAIKVGEPLSSLAVTDRGEVILKNGEPDYQPWDTASLAGKVSVVQYMAARMSVKDMNKPFTDAIEQAAFPKKVFAMATLVNVDDALWGTSGMINSELKKNKQKYPDSTIVADHQGKGLAQWELQTKSSAITVMDPSGRVVFFKEGALSEQEVSEVMMLIEQMLNGSSSAAAQASVGLTVGME